MRIVSSGLVKLWQLIVAQPSPPYAVDILRNSAALGISLEAHKSVTWLLSQLVARQFLKEHGVGRHRQVWWECSCHVPPGCLPPTPQSHPATTPARVALYQVTQ